MKKSFSELRQLIIEAETNKEKLVLEKLSYNRDELDPILSKTNLDIHYGKLASAYVDRFNKNEGDDKFNKAGAILHNIFFAQFKKPSTSNKPVGAILEIINKHYNNFDSFKNEMLNSAMNIQGSGWVYLAHNGKIKTIKNHEIFQDILVLIDWWEHSWFLDYGHDKKKYLTNIWRIIDWAVINDRVNLNNKK